MWRVSALLIDADPYWNSMITQSLCFNSELLNTQKQGHATSGPV